MNITQLRNATVVIEYDQHVILVDPMFAPKGAIPPLKYVGKQRRRNPLVELPENADRILERVTHCLITHCQKGHFDHLDRAAVKWLRNREIPILCMEGDSEYLSKKGLKVLPLKADNAQQPFLEGSVTPVPCLHGRGVVGKFMAHGYGYFIQWPGEPSLYLAGDTIFTPQVEHCLSTYRPDVSVLPAGGANFDLGGEIIMGAGDMLTASQISTGKVIANHLEALDHCPVTRKQLMDLRKREKLEDRLLIPEDGETLCFAAG